MIDFNQITLRNELLKVIETHLPNEEDPSEEVLRRIIECAVAAMSASAFCIALLPKESWPAAMEPMLRLFPETVAKRGEEIRRGEH